LYGIQEIDKGNVNIFDGIRMGYLPQQMTYQSGKTVLEEAKTAFFELKEIEAEIDTFNQELTERTDYESESYSQVIQKLSELNDLHHVLGGNKVVEKTEKTLLGLGFKPEDFNRLTDEFSGGWRMRIELTKILIREPDVLLLDEPTNHLDIESIQWLETFLSRYTGAIILISHDRLFLDTITNRTIEISLGKIYDYKTSYSQYLIQRKERREQQLAAYKNQQKVIETTEAFINRFRYQATKAVQVQSRIKQLAKLERIEIDEEDRSAVHIKFPQAPRSGNIVLEIKNLSKSFDDNKVLKQIDLFVKKGEKLAFVGKNGEGKTTLSRIIIGEHDYEGLLKIGQNVKIGYFAQNQDSLLDKNKTVFQTLDDIAVGDIRTKLRDILGAFLFRGEDIDKKVKVLSGGEQSRLALAKLLLEPVNLLVLDEPTNHLDIVTKNILKEALKSYNGTMIIVSHDRDFLNGLTDKLIEFKNKNIIEHLGGIQEFLEKKKMESLDDLNIKKKKKNIIKDSKDKNKNYQKRKELDKNIRKIRKEIEQNEQLIESLEKKIEELSLSLANQSINFTPEDFKKNSQETVDSKKLLDATMRKWEQLNYELEIVEDQRKELE
jgi:ATP-binding cassette subfamily F protein 3